MIKNSINPEKLIHQLDETRTNGVVTAEPDNMTAEVVSKNIFLPWKDLQEDKLKAVRQIKTTAQKREYLKHAMNLEMNYPTEDVDAQEAKTNLTRREIFLDLMLSTISFSMRLKFTHIQTSCLVSIVKYVHIAACELPGPPMLLAKAYTMFEDLLLKHSVERPPFSISVFSYADTKAINAHMVATYFRHLKMYQYVFGTINELELDPTTSVALAVPAARFKSLSAATAHTEAAAAAQEDTADADEDGGTGGDQDAAAEETGEKAEEDGEQESAAAEAAPQLAVNAPNLPPLQNVLKSREEQDMFEKALTYELVKIQKELNEKLAEQQEAFNAKLAEVEAGGLGSARSKAAAGGKKK
mmetsp:Transcript_26728/g.52678  ORF Transcript_26728/g.52678 Transcript_26728/m.52678 type:complete len:356 (-) Transcript_26728:257-1324(-)|eukprot:CAMPEP_0175091660 /NCGR_PEP_ID=MMETSP0086_2-20121207/2026_1 /TAXON_ID=136419 /ORGANISM="Unknown Unknown, Strain D1" /LENGTH=355 /DNA_ID=CAMNT_0016364427 /DNA_START=42 /DNA_END=1109 /DNA_ORIENTATION=-